MHWTLVSTFLGVGRLLLLFCADVKKTIFGGIRHGEMVGCEWQEGERRCSPPDLYVFLTRRHGRKRSHFSQQ